MRPRRLLHRVTMPLGLAALLLALAALQGVFLRERDEGLEALETNRALAVSLARAAIDRELTASLDWHAAMAARAEADPLAAAPDTLLLVDGRQQLPRMFHHRTDATAPISETVELLVTGRLQPPAADDESPAAERLRLFGAFARAVTGADRTAITEAYRQLVGHRGNFRIELGRDIALRLAALKLLAGATTPSNELMRLELRDGLSLGPRQSIAGLQRLLLTERSAFAADDFDRLADDVLRLSEAHGVRYDDFAGAMLTRSVALSVDDLDVSGRRVVGDWVVQPIGEGRVVGHRLDLAALRQPVLDAISHLGVDDVQLQPPDSRGYDLDAIAITPVADRWHARASDLNARYRYKTALNLLCLALFVGTWSVLWWAQRRRQRLVDLKSEFVATVSHELKTPLTSMRLQAETLERRLPEDSELTRYPERIIRDADGLTELVENILSFNRLHHEHVVLNRGEGSLAELVQTVAADVAANAGGAVDIDCSAVSDRPIRGDLDLLRILLANLVRNGLVYNRSQPPRVTIAASSDRLLTLHVADNGVGIAPDRHDAVFEAFTREAGNTTRGSGLGLALARRIARLHGGDIVIVASSPAGTTFRVTLDIQ